MSAHPRPRGEHPRQRSPERPCSGSSPPTRGTRRSLLLAIVAARLIPAHAGNTWSVRRRSGAGPAHPRPRGEHGILGFPLVPVFGSSPPTRGTPRLIPHPDPVGRLIPAHAGNTRRAASLASSSSAHPRPRGEHASAAASSRWHAGSSPPTRGTRGAEGVHPCADRLIPAHAGNTWTRRSTCPRSPAHPRPRGEHTET